MKKLYLFRHCKAAEPSADTGDRDRPLSWRGPGDAAAVGAGLAELGTAPELVLCSSARRAVETAELAVRAFDAPPPIEPEEGLYTATPGDVLARVQSLDDDLGSVMVVGHAPTLADLALQLAGGGDPAFLDAMAQKFPAGAVAGLEFDTGRWAGLAPGGGNLTLFLNPKTLGA